WLGTDDWGDAENAPEFVKTSLPLTGRGDRANPNRRRACLLEQESHSRGHSRARAQNPGARNPSPAPLGALDGNSALDHSPPHERPQPDPRHLPGDYPLATFAGCGRLFSIETDGRPAGRSGEPWT